MRKQIIAGIILFTIALTFAVFFGRAMSSEAHSEDDPIRYKYYTSITVHSGDTLESIAGEYMSKEYKNTQAYIHEVCMINHIDEEYGRIVAGENIVVPYYEEVFK